MKIQKGENDMDMKKFKDLLDKRTRNMKKSGLEALEERVPEKWGKLNAAIDKLADAWLREFLYGRLLMKRDDPALKDLLKEFQKIEKEMRQKNAYTLIQYYLYHEGDLTRAAEVLAPYRRKVLLAYFPYWEKHVTGKGTKTEPYTTDLLEEGMAVWDEKANLWRGPSGTYIALPPKKEVWRKEEMIWN